MAGIYDLIVVGGGINGCGIARDAAGRGYSVFLAERHDLASGTSSGSTKLIHGGLRYLEHYEFRLVREALKEREVLWQMAPHIVWPLRFVLPHTKGLRPGWLLRLGLFLYDHLGGRRHLPATRVIDLRSHPAGAPLKSALQRAYEYSDCWVDDARLVVLNAVDAAARGAVISTRTVVTGLAREGDTWLVSFKRAATGETGSVRARMVINAAGPWIDTVLGRVGSMMGVRNVRLVQGSHIVVNRLHDHDGCYIFQNSDGRIVFAIPYEQDFTLIGTTDRDFRGDLDDVRITAEEVDYICSAASEYFSRPITREDVVWTYSAVRPLYDDGASKAQEATRDYVLKVEGANGEPKLLNIFGGKITTYRRLAQSALTEIDRAFGRKTSDWTGDVALPGGEFPFDGAGEQARALADDYPFLDAVTVRRLVRCYGTRARQILGDARSLDDLGRQFGAGLSEREVDYLRRFEWAVSSDDILWRRTKLGLRLTDEEKSDLGAWLADHPAERGQDDERARGLTGG